MSEPTPVSDREVEWRTLGRVLLIGLVAFPAMAAINATSLLTDAARTGAVIDTRLPWITEFTSAVSFVLLVPVVALLERRFPLLPGRILRSAAVLAPASVVFSLLHVALMVALRMLLVPWMTGERYQFFGDPVADLVYEYRQDLFVYAVILGLLTLSRQIELGRQELAAAVVKARESGRLTLKSGGESFQVPGADLEWATAAGNYVELRAGGRTYLPRITLADLEEQLQNAGVDVVQVHRSHLVNRAKVRRVRPTSSGDAVIQMADGTEVKGSRRYRDRLQP